MEQMPSFSAGGSARMIAEALENTFKMMSMGGMDMSGTIYVHDSSK